MSDHSVSAWVRGALILLGAFGGLPAAQAVGSGCENLRGQPINFKVDWQTQVKPIINELFPTGRCTSCHNPGQLDGGLDLTDLGIDAIYKILPSGYVVAGRPDSSPLLDKVNCSSPAFGGTRMPAAAPGLAGTPLTLAQQGLIYDWIAQGAPGDLSTEPPIPRDFVFADGGESLR